MGLSRYTQHLKQLLAASPETEPEQLPAAGLENTDIRFPEDDPATLEMMVTDMAKSSPLYRPTGVYAKH